MMRMLLGLVCPLVGAATANDVLQPASMESWIAMETDVPQGVHSGWLEGDRCMKDDSVSLTFMLHYSAKQRTMLHEALMNVSDPASAAYGQHKTREEVAQMVALPQSVAKVTAFLAKGGVKSDLITTSQHQDSVTVRRLPCRIAEQLLSTSIR